MKFKTHEKTIFSAVILILLCINLLPILTVTAKPPPGKGKPNKGSADIYFLYNSGENIWGNNSEKPEEPTVIGASSSLDDDGRLTFARANFPPHGPPFNLSFFQPRKL